MHNDQTSDRIDPADRLPLQYPCPCGKVFAIPAGQGGSCPVCKRTVSSSLLEHNLSVTLQIAASPRSLDATRDSHGTLAGLSGDRQDQGLPAGTRLGHFEIVRQLGAGGMGQVYCALDRSLQRYVAVKVLRSRASSDLSDSDREIELLMQEAIAQARVPHPNVVPIYYVGKHDGAPFLAMELVAGQTLLERMSKRGFSFSEIASIAVQLTDALRFAHQLDLIHGDIKPSNILVQEDLLAKLSDFGMARRASGNTAMPVGGTPNYLAPELLEGGQPSVQSDIYALGVTLYELTFGNRPVQLSGRTAAEWAESHRRSKLTFPRPWPDHLPEYWEKILGRMLAPKAQDRYQDYDSLRADLVRVYPGNSPAARVIPRMIAAAIDFTLVLSGTLLLFLAGSLLLNSIAGYFQVVDLSWFGLAKDDSPWYTNLSLFLLESVFHAVCFLPVFLHIVVAGYWRHTLGRRMMHIHVVNRFGLPPARRTFTIREAIRVAFLWALPVLVVFWTGLNAPVWGLAFVGLAILWTVLNTGWMVFGRRGQPLHDRMLATRAVLDIQS